MFKSVFVKYISAFMLINILSIFLSTSVITTLVNTYDENNKSRTLANIAYSVTAFIIDDYTKSDEISFNDYLNKSVYPIKPMLDALDGTAENLVIFIADGEGNVKLVGGSEQSDVYAGEDGIVSSGEALTYPASVTAALRDSFGMSRNDKLDGFFPEKHFSYIQPITTKNGVVVGSVMACTMNSDMDDLLEAMIKTIIMSTLWLMLAALIAVYFITERLVSPIRAMSRAARAFAAGKFDVRIESSGNDEVAELATAFNNMANSMQHSTEVQRLFLANVSHDLRTPMTTIKGYIENIQSGAIPQDKVPHYLGVISTEVTRLSRLVSSLLDITKIQAGERKFDIKPFDICEMAREIIIFSEQRLEAKQLDVMFDADRDNMFVNADRESIHQILSNICDNAIKFSKDGGRYEVSIKDAGPKTVVSVYNEGIGIAEEELPYVFDRFYKSDKSRGLDKTGVGLGLFIARTIIEAHNETIKVESEYGKWCRFTFTLQKANKPAPSVNKETINKDTE
ncbi:MAG: HAMP domain-containing histidine kinase [Clostridia bacterium]|nr:HAMP domain-containing histidine kinase [Clostridia bacterium]MBP3293556.1 HAMP domain-containing histidine kinase [Clostridia bacterium]